MNLHLDQENKARVFGHIINSYCKQLHNSIGQWLHSLGHLKETKHELFEDKSTKASRKPNLSTEDTLRPLYNYRF